MPTKAGLCNNIENKMTNENEYKEFLAFQEWKAKQIKKKVVKPTTKFVQFDVSNISQEQLKKAGDKLNEVLAFVNKKQKSNWTLKENKSFLKELNGRKYLAVTIARTTPTAEQRTSVYAGIPKTWKSVWSIDGVKQPIDRVALTQ
jgi:hypothetical protein